MWRGDFWNATADREKAWTVRRIEDEAAEVFELGQVHALVKVAVVQDYGPRALRLPLVYYCTPGDEVQ